MKEIAGYDWIKTTLELCSECGYISEILRLYIEGPSDCGQNKYYRE